MPDIIPARAGTHTGLPQYALRNSTPDDASRSRLGVLTMGWPIDPRKGPPCSSAQINRMFGLLAADRANGDWAAAIMAAPNARREISVMSLFLLLGEASGVRLAGRDIRRSHIPVQHPGAERFLLRGVGAIPIHIMQFLRVLL